MVLQQTLEQREIENVKFSVLTLQDLRVKINPARLPKDWLLWASSEIMIYFIKPKVLDSIPTIEYSLSINESLVVKAFAKSQQVKLALNTITDVRQIEDILEKLEHVEEVSCQNTQSLPQLITNATSQLRTAVSNLEEENELVHDYTNRSDILPHLQFIFNQLENLLVPKDHRRYNLITLVMSLQSQLISPACYRYLQSLDYISLPHHSTLQRLYSNIGLDSEFTRFLQQSTLDFNNMERSVILQMDEVHVKSEYTYKGGKIIGSAMQPGNPAKTVFAIMVSSLYKKWSTVVRLLPCSKSSASELYPIIRSVINDIENSNLMVEVICTDNYPMNVSLQVIFTNWCIRDYCSSSFLSRAVNSATFRFCTYIKEHSK